MPEVSGLELLHKSKTARSPNTRRASDRLRHGSERSRGHARRRLRFPAETFSSESLNRWCRALDSVRPKPEKSSHTIVTQDPQLARTIDLACQAAQSSATVMIEAESGTGKELLARMIHSNSPRSSKPFVAVNCAALPESLLESELFGFEKGSFTGAGVAKPGKFELADHGTLLLDEIGEMAPILQAKLLRVLQEKEVDRIGGQAPVEIDVRVIATTNRNLQSLVRDGSFREDLYYRLNVVKLTIPPLRERRGDIPLLVDFFCKRYGRGRDGIRIHPEAMEVLQLHDWPGNVRELENTIQRAVALSAGSQIEPGDLGLGEVQPSHPSFKHADLGLSGGITMREMEKTTDSQNTARHGRNAPGRPSRLESACGPSETS